MAPELSLKILQCIAMVWVLIGIPFSLASFIKSIKGIISLVEVDRVIYSASVDDRVISICSLEAQMSGQPANMI